ncbi:unnamed protein product [Choristocarpus tenellus]
MDRCWHIALLHLVLSIVGKNVLAITDCGSGARSASSGDYSYVIGDDAASCDAACSAHGGSCDRNGLNIDPLTCCGILESLGGFVPLTPEESLFDYDTNLGYTVNGSYFRIKIDENDMPMILETSAEFGCIISGISNATDPASYDSGTGGTWFGSGKHDSAEGRPFKGSSFLLSRKNATCSGSVDLARRLCSCSFPVGVSTPASTPALSLPLKLAPRSVAKAVHSLDLVRVDEGLWRTTGSSGDIRACPIPALCEGGLGGGDRYCIHRWSV